MVIDYVEENHKAIGGTYHVTEGNDESELQTDIIDDGTA
jgi:hypothetical protein